MPRRQAEIAGPQMTGHRIAPQRSSELEEVAAILAEARRNCDAGLGLSGDDARSFLAGLRQRARARVADSDPEPS